MACVAVEDRRQLLTSDRIIGAKGAVTVALKDPLLGSPGDGIGIPLAGGYVAVACAALGSGAAIHAPQDRGQHGAGRRFIGAEQGAAGTHHQFLLIDKHDIIIEPIVFCNINESACIYRRLVLNPFCK